MTDNILLFGRTGQLGWELRRTLAPLGKIYAYGSRELDLKDIKSLVKVIREVSPKFIVNAAAYTAVDQAESEPEFAMTINGLVPGVIAEEASTQGSVFVHYSTDYVFDGEKRLAYTEEDLPNPLNMYGKSKLAGETSIFQAGGLNLVFRTSWVYSLFGSSFVSKVLGWSRKQQVLRIVNDQIGSPTWARMLAEITSTVLACSKPDSQDYFLEKSGIYHVGGRGGVSRYEFAKAILRLDPHPEEHRFQRLEPANTSDFPAPSIRPLNTTLDCSRFEKVFGCAIPNWEETLTLAMEKELK